MSKIPENPKIYHIVHVDRISSIAGDAWLFSDSAMAGRKNTGTTIGMKDIKERRQSRMLFPCYADLSVGQCVPFYFCPRSVMLYVIHMQNHPGISYRGGQEAILHLEADLRAMVAWAETNQRRWAITLSNAASYYCEVRVDLGSLGDINWEAIRTRHWAGNNVSLSLKEDKQAEFLVEESCPWRLVERIGVHSREIGRRVWSALNASRHRPEIRVMREWYY